MRILIASPSRDLLDCYTELLSQNGNEVLSAFDGVQTMDRLARRPDAAVIDCNITRIDRRRLVRYANEEMIPSVVLLDRRIDLKLLSENDLPSSFLTYPFLPEELSEAVDAAVETAESGEIIDYQALSVRLKDRTFCGRMKLTVEEISILRFAVRGETTDRVINAVYVNSLNFKLKSLNKKQRIKYITNEGYRLVTDDE